MCRKKRVKSIYVVKRRSEDRIPYSLPIISKGNSNMYDPMGPFISTLHGTDVKDDTMIIRTSTDNIDSIRNMNSKKEEDILKGFNLIGSKKEKMNEEKDTRRNVLDILNDLDQSSKREEIVTEEVNDYKTYTFTEEVPTIKEEHPKYEEPHVNTDNSNFNERVEYTVKSQFEESLSLDELSILRSGHQPKDYSNYIPPSLSFLKDPEYVNTNDEEWKEWKRQTINKILVDFKIGGHVEEITTGPTFTRFAVKLDPGVSGSKIDNISADIQRLLEVPVARIENPIPGRALIGIEVPNKIRKFVSLKEVLNREEFRHPSKPLLVPTGLNVDGEVKFVSIENPPHGIIAGQSGSGKSVFLNTLILSLVFQYSPNDLRFLFVDPKQVDIAPYSTIPHLMAPIVEKISDAVKMLKFLVDEMNRRYSIFKIAKVQKIEDYRELAKKNKDLPEMPYIVFVVEEAGSFLDQGGKEVESLIVLLTNKSRAAGIHVFLSMQKPVAKTLSTSIKSNMALRFAFSVTSAQDSIIILNEAGAEKLLKKGDMIFSDGNTNSRYQVANVDTDEIQNVINYLSQYEQDFYFNPLAQEDTEQEAKVSGGTVSDEYFKDACRYVVRNKSCSANTIQHTFGISWYRATGMVKAMEELGIVDESRGTTSRRILVDEEYLEEILRRI